MRLIQRCESCSHWHRYPDNDVCCAGYGWCDRYTEPIWGVHTGGCFESYIGSVEDGEKGIVTWYLNCCHCGWEGTDG